MSDLKRYDKFLCLNSLVCLVKGLEGKCTTIDLRNESYVTGRIINVGPYMGIELEKVLFHDPRGFTYVFDSFFIKPRNIRYVHIPKGIDATTLIKSVIDEANTTYKQKDSKVHTFKRKRAQNYQQDILKSLVATASKP